MKGFPIARGITLLLLLLTVTQTSWGANRKGKGAAAAAKSAPANWGWLAYGDLRGHLEPCGCDPKTDLGGLRRLASFMRRERALVPEVAVLDLGNNVAVGPKGDSYKSRFMLEGAAILSPDVRLLNLGELDWLTGRKRGKIGSTGDLGDVPFEAKGWVLSNHMPHIKGADPVLDLFAKVPRRVVLPKVVVFGFVTPSGAEKRHKMILSPLSEGLLETWRKDIEKAKKPAILMFSGTEQELSMIVGAKLFADIISSNAAAGEVEPGKEEKEKPGLLQRSKSVWMVPLGGQGVLRGGIMRQKAAQSLEALLKSGAPGAASPVQKASGPEFVTWLDTSYEAEGVVDELFGRYNEFAKDLLAQKSEVKKAALKDSPFAGADACQSCHKSAFDKWKETEHSKALVTLKAKGKDQDPECVACHVVGFDQKGGFVSEADSPQFAGVQCENCHGPRKAHIANPNTVRTSSGKKGAKVAAKDSCKSCHNSAHSSSFAYGMYWPKIAHGK